MNTTIKSSLCLISAALLLAACSEEDAAHLGDSETNPIRFRTSLPTLSSRAQIVTNDNLPHFFVTAFNPADPDLVTPTGLMKEYISQEPIINDAGLELLTSEKCLWPAPGKDGNLAFFAFYPDMTDGAGLVNATTLNGNDLAIDYKLTDFRVAADIADQQDFITAYATGSMEKNLFAGITLNFEHQLSRVELQAWGANKSCNIEIAGVRLGGVGVESTFDFQPIDGGGQWVGYLGKGIVEYIYRNGDQIVSLDRTAGSPLTADAAVSIMGSKVGTADNCAMLLPATYSGWDFLEDGQNQKNQMYISVLLRVVDATPTDGEGQQQYPLTHNIDGSDALNIPKVYLAVDKLTGKTVSSRLYKNGDDYFTDETFTSAYTLTADEEVKEFGWAALPVTGEWEPGYVYTYTLDYTSGVGLHDPDSPDAGKPIISDKVGVSVSVKDWQTKPSSGVVVPGS
ncbi:MAG: fimbrillin family protein [Duncaniella sp.]|uniref:fimbrillin family protein n=1 Tax=Duncaniella sp. TaxID=2518496 RepID=UPI0023C28569|nr:fimbrillin family protein [Duncaniella sp.]MDE6090175.1 fimbrillin family protein [Duncaniella sp.]